MVESKAWDWEAVTDEFWLEPCEESYYYAKRWLSQGKKSLLDLGCGLGRHAIMFAKKGFKVTAVDLSDYAVDHLLKWQDNEGLNVMTKKSDMNHLPFHDQAFDCVWAYHVISHTDTQGFLNTLNEIKRVLKPNGEIYLSLCSKSSDAFSSGRFPKVDDQTILKTEGQGEKEVPHYYVDMDDIIHHFKDFNIRHIRHVDDCFYNGAPNNSMHYFISASLDKRPQTLDYSHILGKRVQGLIDRPLGTSHPSFDQIKYTVNYGYVEGVRAGDGHEQDIYLLGVDHPVECFDAKVIAVVHRLNDNEDKWIVANENFSKEAILEAIDFQEKYFDYVLYM